MTTLFRRLQPRQKFRITINGIAQLLKIPKHLIVRIECWAYIIFIHRGDKGGQFLSYRKLQQWQNAIACQIQNCSTCQELRSLWLEIEQDCKKYKNSTTKSISHFYAKSGQNALERFGTSKNQRFLLQIKACLRRLSLYSARLLV
jgi:dsDNA-specific endonuclease/ATPase MutS2